MVWPGTGTQVVDEAVVVVVAPAVVVLVDAELVVDVELVAEVVVDVTVEKVPATMYMFKRSEPPQYSRGLLAHIIEQPVF